MSETSKLIICVLYWPPSAPLADFQACSNAVHEFIEGKDDFDTCILGDFNFPNISWDPTLVSSSSPSTELFEIFMNDHLYLSQNILKPTRMENTG